MRNKKRQMCKNNRRAGPGRAKGLLLGLEPGPECPASTALLSLLSTDCLYPEAWGSFCPRQFHPGSESAFLSW